MAQSLQCVQNEQSWLVQVASDADAGLARCLQGATVTSSNLAALNAQAAKYEQTVASLAASIKAPSMPSSECAAG